MAIRAQPVKSVFQRMPRLVREVAEATGKRVRLVTEGEGTEVDKTVVERLSDPITHMIRNAIDHGLETPAEREANGKSGEGVVRRAAAHRSGRIVIEVADKGRCPLGLFVAGDPEGDRAGSHVGCRVEGHVLDVDAGLAERQRQRGDRPRLVGDDHSVTPLLAKVLGNQTSDNIGGPDRRE